VSSPSTLVRVFRLSAFVIVAFLSFYRRKSEGQKRENKKKLQCLAAGMSCRASLSVRAIEEESRYVVVEAAMWSGEPVHFGMPGASSE
jgi:hypothetical protein